MMDEKNDAATFILNRRVVFTVKIHDLLFNSLILPSMLVGTYAPMRLCMVLCSYNPMLYAPMHTDELVNEA